MANESLEKVLEKLTGRLREAFGTRLNSVILYGSRAGGDAQNNDSFSDLNVLCVLAHVTTVELAAAQPIFHWWRGLGNPSPLLMSREEALRSTDCFPIEFTDMQERRKVLHGEDIIEGIVIDQKHHRAEVEHEMRSKLLRLRQKAAGILSEKDLLLRLMADSVSTFLVLGRHVLLMAGYAAPWSKREVAAELGTRFGFKPKAFYTLVDLREERIKSREIDPRGVLELYLAEIGAVITAVDNLEL
jgi:hypothetical protein